MKNCLVDLDGTVYRGDTPIEHADAFIEHLKRIGRKYLFVTNCPDSPGLIADKLESMGIDARGRVLTSGMVALGHLRDNFPGKKVFAIGSPDFLELLYSGGIRLSFADPDIVLVGYDTDFTCAKLEMACGFILGGAAYMGTNLDATIPRGVATVPHTGALLAAITAVTGKTPLCFGKPSHFMLDAALAEMRCGKDECAVVGDRIDTDIEFAVLNGIPGYLVLTGSSTRETVRETVRNGGSEPTLVVENLLELIERDLQGGL